MAKLVIAIRETPAGTPANNVDVEVALASNPASPLTTITTNADGLATYEVDGNPGPLVLDGTIGGKTKLRDGRTQDQMGTFFPEDLVYILRTLGNGVIKGYSDPDTAANDMALSPGTGRKINVGTGAIILDGRVYRCTATTALDIDANATGSTRYDRVVARLTRDGQTEEGKFELAVLTGTTDSAGPSLTKSSATMEYSLGKIQVVNGAASFVSGDITDERYSTTLYQAYVQLNPNAFLTQAASWTNGDLLYVSGGTVTRLPIGSANQILKVSSGVPTWSTVALTLVVQAGDSTVDAAVSTLDFSSTQFDVTSSPSGEANISIKAGGVGATELASGAVTDAKVASGIDATKIGNGDVTNTELSYLANVTSDVQTQLNNIEWPTVQVNDVTVSSAADTFDFSSAFTGTESPSGEVNIGLNLGTGAAQAAAGNHTHAGYSPTSHEHELNTPISGSALAGYSYHAVGTSSTTVANFNLGPLTSGVTYHIVAKTDMQGNAPSGGYITAQIRIEASGTTVDGMQQGTESGERPISAVAFKTVVGTGSSINIAARAQSTTGTGSITDALVWAVATPLNVPAT